jgi:hypothetical protein
MKDTDSLDKSSFEESNEKEVKKGFEEAADEVAKYFGWNNDEIIDGFPINEKTRKAFNETFDELRIHFNWFNEKNSHSIAL